MSTTCPPWTIHGLGEEGSHLINALPMGIYGPHMHSTCNLHSFQWVLGCWTTIATWRPRWVVGPTMWVCIRQLYVIAPHRLTYVICTYILHSTIDAIIHCNHFYLLEIWDWVLKHYQNLQYINTYFGCFHIMGYCLDNISVSFVLNKFIGCKNLFRKC